jgi:hypothetical protein
MGEIDPMTFQPFLENEEETKAVENALNRKKSFVAAKPYYINNKNNNHHNE